MLENVRANVLKLECFPLDPTHHKTNHVSVDCMAFISYKI